MKAKMIPAFLCIFIPMFASGESLESCSRFLPEGTSYEITITTLVNKDNEEPKFDGNINIDWSEENVENLKFELSDYIKCVAPLITSEPELEI
ncbi:hypothetical protein [Vibrio sp. HN007]|uniref:hypothetical protein n=1 Tax=Vibrio iocasae TaxID=3098914 RepID=UPI0035D4110F